MWKNWQLLNRELSLSKKWSLRKCYHLIIKTTPWGICEFNLIIITLIISRDIINQSRSNKRAKNDHFVMSKIWSLLYNSLHFQALVNYFILYITHDEYLRYNVSNSGNNTLGAGNEQGKIILLLMFSTSSCPIVFS